MSTSRAASEDELQVFEQRKPAVLILGYALAAVILWIVSMMISHRIPGSFTTLTNAVILTLSGGALAVLGSITWKYRNSQDTIIFFGLSLLFLSIGAILFIFNNFYGNAALFGQGGFGFPVIKPDYSGWFNLTWGVVFGSLCVLCRASGMTRMLFLLLLSAGALNVAVAGWAQIVIFRKIGACFFLIAAICSGLNAVSSLILLKMKKPFH